MSDLSPGVLCNYYQMHTTTLVTYNRNPTLVELLIDIDMFCFVQKRVVMSVKIKYFVGTLEYPLAYMA